MRTDSQGRFEVNVRTARFLVLTTQNYRDVGLYRVVQLRDVHPSAKVDLREGRSVVYEGAFLGETNKKTGIPAATE